MPQAPRPEPDVSVLLVDDSPANLLALEAVLGDLGYNLVSARSGEEALGHLSRQDFAVILLDVRMPTMGGFETAKRVRSLARSGHTPIIFITAQDDGLSLEQAYALGAVDYLVKPIVPVVLRAKVAVFVDLYRARSELEQRVQERTAQLRALQQRALQTERLAAIGQTFTALAHESRNAFQRSQGCLERLRWRLEGEPEALDLVDRALQAQKELQRLYEDVRGYAAPLVLERKPCDLAAVWRQAWAELDSAREGRDTELRGDTGGLDLTVEADAFRLGQVFRNLFANSLDASPGRVVIEIRCSATTLASGEAVRVSVRDSGTGLTEEQRRRLFEPFYTTKTRGTGLGMAIVRRNVEAHAGKVEVGEGGPGVEVVLTLPKGT